MSNRLSTLQQLFRFAYCGVISTLIHFLVALSIIELFIESATVANIGGFSIALFVSYGLNFKVVFRTNSTATTFKRFLVVNTSLFLLTILFSFWADLNNIKPLYTLLVTISIIPIFNFLLHKVWTFR
ncbi:GtrA family protein [Aliikangiella sp. IMCC44653]